MISQCLKTFNIESSPLSDRDLEQLVNIIINIKENNPEVELYEIIHDEIYDYLIKN